MTNLKPVSLFNIQVNALSMAETVEIIATWLAGSNQSCHFVVTPNVDHIVQLDTNQSLQSAYRNAALVVVDGKPVVWAANLLGRPLPGTVPGSDLVPAIFENAQKEQTHLKVFLLGAMPGVAERAKLNIETQWPMVQIVGTHSPAFGFEKDTAYSTEICRIVNATNAQLLLVGVGAPKQELWVNAHASQLRVHAALCIGATIDFLAGEKARAPIWMRKLGLEWLHRMSTEPRRLAKRYFIDAIVFPRLIAKAWWQRRRAA